MATIPSTRTICSSKDSDIIFLIQRYWLDKQCHTGSVLVSNSNSSLCKKRKIWINSAFPRDSEMSAVKHLSRNN